MKIIRFLGPTNLVDTATLTASSTNADFPVSNLQHIWKTKHHRTTDHESEWIKADLGADTPITAFALAYHNLSASAVVRLQGTTAAVGDNWGGTLVFDVLLPIYSYLAYLWETQQTVRWVRWTIADASNTDGYIKTGRPFIGTWWAPSKNFDNQYARTPKSFSVKTESIGGQISAVSRSLRKELNYQFTDLSEADRALFDTMYESVEQITPYFLVQDADSLSTRVFYVLNTTDWTQEHVMMDAFFNIKISVREAM